MMKLPKTRFLFLLFFLVALGLQKGPERCLVFKITHIDKRYVGYSGTTYALINPSRLDAFKFLSDTVNPSPNVLYHITANGGLYISHALADLYNYSCCKYDDIEKGINRLAGGKIPEDSFEQYALQNKTSLSVFKDNKGIRFSYGKGPVSYRIVVWQARLDYCRCRLYMENPGQPVYNNMAAYIKKIYEVDKPNKRLAEKVQKILDSIIALDKDFKQSP